MSDHLRHLLDRRDIEELRAKYCRFIDTKQWHALRTIFTDDCRFDGFGSAPSGSDVDTFVRGVSTRLKDAVSCHHCHTPTIAFRDGSAARSIWGMADYLEWPAPIGIKEAPDSRGFQGFGYYEEEYRKVGGAWKIAHVRLVRLLTTPLSADHPKPGPIVNRQMPATDWLKF